MGDHLFSAHKECNKLLSIIKIICHVIECDQFTYGITWHFPLGGKFKGSFYVIVIQYITYLAIP